MSGGKKNQKNGRSGAFSMLLAWRMLALNDEKKILGLTKNIWYSTGEEAFIRGSWLCNKRETGRGHVWRFGWMWSFSKVRWSQKSFLEAVRVAHSTPIDRGTES